MEDSKTTGQKVEDMIDYADPLIQKWPNVYKYSLGERMLTMMYEISELCTAAELKHFKKTTLTDIDIKKAQLQKLVRRAQRTKHKDKGGNERQLLTMQNYETWSAKIAEIGRILGSWIKSVKAQEK